MSTRCTPTEAVWHNSDLAHIIFSYASITSVILCQKVNKRFRDLSLLYLDRCLNIHQHLSRFFSDPEGFRRVQRRTSTLISGSNALQFFDRSLYPEADLDLYVHRGRETELATFLLKEGYEYRPSHFQARSFPEQDARVYLDDIRPFGVPWDIDGRYVDPALDGPNFDYDEDDMAEWGVLLLYTFLKQTSDGERQVQIIVASSSPIDCVLRFHCTAVFNVISWDAAYCLYPRATLKERVAVMAKERITSEHVFQKYRDRGFTITQDFSHGDSSYPTESRWIDDRHSWVVKLPFVDWTGPSNALAAPMPTDPVAATNWRLLRPNNPFIAFTTFRGYDLRYEYVITDLELLQHLRETMWRPLFAAYKEFNKWNGPNADPLTPEDSYATRTWFDAEFISQCAMYRKRMQLEQRTPVVHQRTTYHNNVPDGLPQTFAFTSFAGTPTNRPVPEEGYEPDQAKFVAKFSELALHAVTEPDYA